MQYAKEQGRGAEEVEIRFHSFWTTALDAISGRLHAQAFNFVGKAKVLRDGRRYLEKRQHFLLPGIETQFLAHRNLLPIQYTDYSLPTVQCFYKSCSSSGSIIGMVYSSSGGRGG